MSQLNSYEGTVAWATAQSEVAYSLTKQALSSENGVLAFALIAQAFTAIEYGFAAYRGVFVTAELEERKVAAAWARAQLAAGD
jgi:hypothetical protein